jgi:hypothetical protein
MTLLAAAVILERLAVIHGRLESGNLLAATTGQEVNRDGKTWQAGQPSHRAPDRPPAAQAPAPAPACATAEPDLDPIRTGRRATLGPPQLLLDEPGREAPVRLQQQSYRAGGQRGRRHPWRASSAAPS